VSAIAVRVYSRRILESLSEIVYLSMVVVVVVSCFCLIYIAIHIK